MNPLTRINPENSRKPGESQRKLIAGSCQLSAFSCLDNPDVFGSRSLGSLPLFERHGLTFAQIVEPCAGAGRVVEEILVAIAGQNESESLVADEPLDRAVRGCCH